MRRHTILFFYDVWAAHSRFMTWNSLAEDGCMHGMLPHVSRSIHGCSFDRWDCVRPCQLRAFMSKHMQGNGRVIRVIRTCTTALTEACHHGKVTIRLYEPHKDTS